MTANDQDRPGTVNLKMGCKTRVPSKRYYDQEFFDQERDHLWSKVWQMACRLEEIRDVGDFVEYKIFDQSVIIVRSKSGVKAFHNACRHRGVKLAVDRGNCRTKGFICPFHGWRWNIEGENTFVHAKKIFDEGDLRQADINLVPCRIELWGGCVFVNFDGNAPPLLETLGPVAQRLSNRNVEHLKMEWWYQTVLPTNWKLAMEAFMESYHVMRTHPQLYAPDRKMYGADLNAERAQAPSPLAPPSAKSFIEASIKSLELLGEGMDGMVHKDELAIARELSSMELPEDIAAAAAVFFRKFREEITNRGRARGLPVPDLNELETVQSFNAVEYLFPNYFLLPAFSAMASYRIRPLTPETCLFEIWALAFLPEDENREPVTPKLLPYDSEEFPEIPRQDYANLPSQQQGLHTQGFEFMRLSSKFEGMISNYQRLIDSYIAGHDMELLAKASQIVSGGIDHPIVDIGF